jgi:rod shape-determining protein MreD
MSVRAFRLFLLIVLLVVVQVSVFPHLRIAGVAPDLGLIAAVAIGYHLGPDAGAAAGFTAGLGFDLFLETPLGMHALAYALAGYAAGVLEGGLMRAPRLLPVLLGALGGLFGGLLLIGIGVLAGIDSVKGLHGIEVISIAALYDALLAPLVFLLVALAIGHTDAVKSSWRIGRLP